MAYREQRVVPKKQPYLSGIVQLLSGVDRPDDAEMLATLLDNVWTEISPEVIGLCCDKESARDIETLIYNSNETHLTTFVGQLGSSLETDKPPLLVLVSSPFGSYVHDTLLWKLLEIAKTKRDTVTEILSNLAKLYSTFQKQNIIEDITANRNGSVCYRHFLQVLSGAPLDPAPKNVKNLEMLDIRKLKDAAGDLIQDFITKVDSETTYNTSRKSPFNRRAAQLPLEMLHSVHDLVYHSASAPFLCQLLIIAEYIHKKTLIDTLVQSILGNNSQKELSFQRQSFVKMAKQQRASHVVEHLVDVLSRLSQPKFTELYNTYFKGDLYNLCSHPVSNFVVQRLLASLQYLSNPTPSTSKSTVSTTSTNNTAAKDILESALEELAPSFEQLLGGRSGVIWRLCESAGIIKGIDAQKKVLNALTTMVYSKIGHNHKQKSETPQDGQEPKQQDEQADHQHIHLNIDKEFSEFLFYLNTSPVQVYKKGKLKQNKPQDQEQQQEDENQEENENSETKSKHPTDNNNTITNTITATPESKIFSSLGCKILRALFTFHPNLSIPVVRSVLGVAESVLINACGSQDGSRVIDELILSETLPQRYKFQLLDKLKSNYGNLALDRYGSYVVEKCYACADISHKEMIVKELLKVSNKLSTSSNGHFILTNCKLNIYSSDRKAWRKLEKNPKQKREKQQPNDIQEILTEKQPEKLQPQEEKTQKQQKEIVENIELLESERKKEKKQKRKEKKMKKKEMEQNKTTNNNTNNTNKTNSTVNEELEDDRMDDDQSTLSEDPILASLAFGVTPKKSKNKEKSSKKRKRHQKELEKEHQQKKEETKEESEKPKKKKQRV